MSPVIYAIYLLTKPSGQAYKVCSEKDLVPEMVFLLGRMGNNKKALTLIIERLGDVHYVGLIIRYLRVLPNTSHVGNRVRERAA